MSEQYKRSICKMCPIKDACDRVRWSYMCGDCPESLKCAAGPGIGRASCDKIRAAWLELSPRCMLVSHVLQRRVQEGDDRFIKGRDARTVCPRCSFSFFDVAVDHKLNHHFRRETRYIGTCDYCGVDETIGVE